MDEIYEMIPNICDRIENEFEELINGSMPKSTEPAEHKSSSNFLKSPKTCQVRQFNKNKAIEICHKCKLNTFGRAIAFPTQESSFST
jgi:hypothetical protein